MELFTADRHLSGRALRALLDGMLDDLQTLDALGHIADCEACADRFASLASAPESLRTAPRGMAEQIHGKIADERARRTRAKQRDFLRYCASMTAGIAAVIALLFVAPVQLDAALVTEPTKLELPVSTPLTLPEPVKLTLPVPKSVGGAQQTDDEEQQTILEKLSAFFNSTFCNPA